jgi:hypothetical protein
MTVVIRSMAPMLQQRTEDPKVMKALEAGKEMPPIAVTAKQSYQMDVFRRLCRVATVFERIDEVLLLLPRYPRGNLLSKRGLTHDKWMAYHLGQFVAAMTSTMDVCLLLTAEVFQLDLAEQDCKREIVERNRRVKGTAVIAKLRSLDACIQQMKEHRNRDLHRAERIDLGEFAGVKNYQVAEALALLGKGGYGDKDELFYMRIKFEETSEEICKRIESEAVKAQSAVLEVLGALFPIYEGRAKELGGLLEAVRDEIERRKKSGSSAIAPDTELEPGTTP